MNLLFPAKEVAMMQIPTAPVPPFATWVPGRRTELKFHKTLAHVKTAATAPGWFERDRYAVDGRHADGVFNRPVRVFTLQPGSHYRLWIAVRVGSRRIDYPELMPVAHVPVPGRATSYDSVALSRAMRELRRVVQEALKEIDVTYPQLRAKALSGALSPTEASLWAMIIGALPGGVL